MLENVDKNSNMLFLTKKRAYYTPSILLFALLITSIIGVMLGVLSSYVKSSDISSRYRETYFLSDIGLKRGEDWLISNLRTGIVPRSNGLEVIEECSINNVKVTYSGPSDDMRPEDYAMFYFLSSTAVDLQSSLKLTCEELIAVSADISGEVTMIKRLFYRTR